MTPDIMTDNLSRAQDMIAERDATIARLTADMADWKARYFKTRDERDKAQIASANYANFNHEWRQRVDKAEAAGTFAQGIEAAAKEAERVIARFVYFDPAARERDAAFPKAIRALSTTPQADPVREAETAAWAMWKAEAAEGTPKSIYDARTIDAFRSGLNPDDRERWLRKGRAVVAALAQKGE